MNRRTAIEVVAADRNRCGEAPIWDGARRRLIWADIESALVYALDPRAGEKRLISRDVPVSGIALDRTGMLIIGGAGGLLLLREPGERWPIATEHSSELLVFNDIAAGPGGRVYAGTLHWGPGGIERTGRLYLIDRDRSLRIVEEGIELSNGLSFSPDERTLYYADSAARCIYAYQVDPRTGGLSGKRVFVRVPVEEGIPDGLAVDLEGFVWCAQWYGARVVRYAPDGAVERRIDLPVKQVSSLAFGGDDLGDLYITSAADPWPSRLAPPGFDAASGDMGGSLYRVRPGVQGKPEPLADLAGGLGAEAGGVRDVGMGD